MGATLRIEIVLNGAPRTVEVGVHRPLLDVLREELELTGTKECCSVGECGACTVLVDGRSVNSCLMLAVEADGHSVTTIEGLTPADGLNAMQDAFLEHGAAQCGFCIPGMIVSALHLLETTPDPSPEEIREGLSGNLCRCGGYKRMVRAVSAVAARIER
jgi:carbon-monoxide dehydrogenase small subunit